jgi:hypothetical protein
MYVLGDRLAEVIDLDTKAYTYLAGKPWAMNFPGLDGTYLPGPGVSWHARTKQIVAWTGGQNVLLIDPATDVASTVAMSGAAPALVGSSGTYGRFRVLPGTDQVVLVNSVYENVFIGTVPFDGDGTVPSPLPTTGGSMLAQLLGTDLDKVGPGNSLVPDGAPDHHFRLTGVQAKPVVMRRIMQVGGDYAAESPWNGDNWNLLAVPGAAGVEDWWSAVWGQEGTGVWRLRVTYADGTVDECDAETVAVVPTTGREIVVTVSGLRPDLGDTIRVVGA